MKVLRTIVISVVVILVVALISYVIYTAQMLEAAL